VRPKSDDGELVELPSLGPAEVRTVHEHSAVEAVNHGVGKHTGGGG
jgi:hypothetical protein